MTFHLKKWKDLILKSVKKKIFEVGGIWVVFCLFVGVFCFV